MPVPSEDLVREALRQVNDPELGINVVDLGLVYGIDITEGGKVHVRMTLTALGCPLAATIHQSVEAAVKQVPGVQEVETEIVWDPPWNPDMMSQTARMMLGFW